MAIIYIKNNWHKVVLILIMAATFFLSFYAIDQEGYANQYYSAAVKSMLTSWHSFFFASFDAGGYVTVDKPALGLWLQAISAFLFGFHGWSLILPEALSTVVSIALIYHLVQRVFGKTAGIVSALILTLTPILIAVSRTNNLDASLVMVLLLATWAMVVAAEIGSFKLLALSAALLGLGFNIKMLEAYMALPALYLVYMLTAPFKARKRILQLIGATAVLLVVSLSWAVIVDMTPADRRPYVGSSKTNSVLELALGYNGIQRLTGNRDNSSMKSFSWNSGRIDGNNSISISNGGTQDNSGYMKAPPNDRYFQNMVQPPSNGNVPGGFNEGQAGQGGPGCSGIPGGQGAPGGNGGPGGTGENGQKGILRIFNQQLAGQISWFLLMAFYGILVLCLRTFKNQPEDKMSVLRQLILWSAWIIPMLGFFSVAGFFHRYYLSMLAPSIAALSGIGIVEMWKAYMEQGWKWAILPAALVSTAAIQIKILWNYSEWRSLLIPVICGGIILSVAALVIIRFLKKDNLRKTIKAILTVGILGLIIAPAIWAYTPIMYGSQAILPVAGPELKKGDNGFGRNNGPDGSSFAKSLSDERTGSSQLLQFLLSKKQNEKYLVAVADANSAASIILQTGEAVMAVGGFSGSDNILTVEKLSQMVEDGEIRYFQIGGRGIGQQSEISTWVQEHGKVVNFNNENTSNSTANAKNNLKGFGQPEDRMGNDGTLYDLAPEKG